jgi:hypothetical protein
MNVMFKEIAIWRQIDQKNAVKFNCLETRAAEYFHKQYIERLIEMASNEGIPTWFPSTGEAISHHEAESG